MKNKFTQKAAALLCSKKALNRARTAHRLLSMTAGHRTDQNYV